jgi:hypothetical protein
MQDEVKLLRHSIRGTINALSLGTSAMSTGLTRDEAIEFLDYIIQAADKMCSLMDQYDALPDSARPVPPAGS